MEGSVGYQAHVPTEYFSISEPQSPEINGRFWTTENSLIDSYKIVKNTDGEL